MTYQEIKNTYRWTMKHYPGAESMTTPHRLDETIGTVATTRYAKQGSRWVETSAETEDLTPRFYLNSIDAVPFFRGLGGKERVTCGYTYRGYMPIEVLSTSPDGQQRIRREFNINA